ncbi:MAG: hypothetical protein KGL39_50725 [Patescibacteria group bacterium]|nr:hypothetical protein [Patescibacteria group bacterium]
MTPPWGDHVSHDEFQTLVLQGIARLETKMDSLVGQDGNGGKVADLHKRVGVLEVDKNRDSGRINWLGDMIKAGIGGGMVLVANWIWHKG